MRDAPSDGKARLRRNFRPQLLNKPRVTPIFGAIVRLAPDVDGLAQLIDDRDAQA